MALLKKRKSIYAQRHTVFDASTEKKHQSEFIWSSRAAKLLLLVGIFGIAASSFAATPDSLDVNAFDPKKPAIAQAKGFNKKLKAKAPKYHKLHPNKQSQDQDKSQDKAQIIHDIKERKEAIAQAIATNPDEVEAAALPQDVKDALPDEVKGDVESTTEISGRWITGHSESTKPGAILQEQVRVVTSDYHHVSIYGAALPQAPSTTPVTVRGTKLDTIMAVPSVVTPKISALGVGARLVRIFTPKAYAQLSPNIGFCHDSSYAGIDVGDCEYEDSDITLRDIFDERLNAAFKKKVLVIPVKFKGDNTNAINPKTNQAITTNDLSDMITKNDRNFVAEMKRISYGRLNPDVTVHDWETIDEDNQIDCTSNEEIDDLVNITEDDVHDMIRDNKIDARGVTSIVYVFNNVRCDSGPGETLGQSQIQKNDPKVISESVLFLAFNGSSSTPHDNAVNLLPQSLIHEFGHSMGLNHAHSGCDNLLSACFVPAGDEFDRMGYFNSTPYSTEFNAYYKELLGWLDREQIADGSSSAAYNLVQAENLDGANQSSKPRAISIPIEGSGNDVTKALIVEYRSGDGSLSPKYSPGVLIREVSIALSAGKYRGGGFMPINTRILPAKQTTPNAFTSPGLKSPGDMYMYEDPENSATKVCIKLNNETSSTRSPGQLAEASIYVSRGCVSNKQIQAPVTLLGGSNIWLDLAAHATTMNASAASCVNSATHQLFAYDTHRVLEYDLNADNTPIDAHADHVLGANSVGSYLYDGSPVPGIGAYGFSVSWTGKLNVPTTGTYTFETLSDDGVKLLVNDVEVIKNWTDHSATTNTGTVKLNAGQAKIQILYYNNYGESTMRLKWAGLGIVSQVVPTSAFVSPGLTGEYHDNIDFTGKMVTRVDGNLDNPWGFSGSEGVPFAEQGNLATGTTSVVSQKSINYSPTSLACDSNPAHPRLFVAGAEDNMGASRILVFDLSKGITNGMNASYVLGQKDFVSAAKRSSSDYSGNFYKSNPAYFYPNQIAFSSKYNTLFVSQSSQIPRILAFDLSAGITNGMNPSYVIGKKTGDFTSIPSNVALEPFGQPYGLGIDEVNDRLFISTFGGKIGGTYYGNPAIVAVNIPKAKTDGLATLGVLKLGDKFQNSTSYMIPGSLATSADGNTLFEMSASGSYGSGTKGVIGSPLNVIDVTPSKLKNGVNNGTPSVVVALDGYDSLSNTLTLDEKSKLMYVPARDMGRIDAYRIPTLDLTDWSKAAKGW